MQVKKIKDALKFTPIGEPVGNLTIGRAQLATVTGPQRNCYVAIVENKIASGALGALECQRLGSLFTICMRENAALVLYLDSAGAKVSEGHMALGAFRKLFKHALQMSARNVAVVTVLGTHCYGGASMLAQAGQICLYGAHTKLAMSGPTILAQAAGADVFDASFQAIAQAAIGGSARTALSQRNRILPENIDAKGLEIAVIRAFTDIAAEPNWGAYKHAELKARAQNWGVDKLPVEAFTRDDCDKLFADGYAVQRQGDVIFGTANYHGVLHDVLGIAAPGTRTLGALSAPSAWALAQRALALAGASAGASTGAGHLGANSKPCLILLDCESHSTQINDEKALLSAYLHHLSQALFTLAQSRIAQQPGGVSCIVLRRAGGGVFMAFAAACKVAMLYQAQVQLLPASAISNILGSSSDATVEFKQLVDTGVAEEELKIGYIAP